MKQEDIQPGQLVDHKNGHKYMIIGVGLHTETEEPLVIYSPYDEPNIIWARPLEMFLTPGRFRISE
jgi:hypothetical protein